MLKKIDIIETERLLLRGIDESDADSIVKWRSDPAVYCFFKYSHAITQDAHLKWFHESYLQNKDRFDWMCIDRTTGKRVGVFGLIREKRFTEVNYILEPDSRHKGYATESVSALIEYSKEKWKTKVVTAEIHKDNIASIDFIERLGFQLKRQQDPFLVFCKEV